MTIGVFDGVHVGHQHVFEQLRTRAAGSDLTPTILTFNRHPLNAVDPSRTPQVIDPAERRVRLLDQVGIDIVGVLNFDDHLRLSSAEDFCRNVLARSLKAKLIVVGTGFRFGHRATGSIETLQALSDELGFEVVEAELLYDNGDVVSSSRIRELISTGRVDDANRLLGRPFRRDGAVIEGDHRGAAIGFPTANIAVAPGLVTPANGVYVCSAHHGAKTYPAAVNVGVRPTFGGKRRVIEAHLLDFKGDLYGDELGIEFIERLRPEMEFAGVTELVAQIAKDVEFARARLL